MTNDTEEPSAASAGSLFDAAVRAIRSRGVKPQHKPCGRKKADCTAEQWAAHLEWRATYYSSHREQWDMYRNRWLAKKR